MVFDVTPQSWRQVQSSVSPDASSCLIYSPPEAANAANV